MGTEPAAGAISDVDLVVQFESLGDNCELGLVQRRAGQEPLGLLRFAGAPLRHLLLALGQRFAQIAEPRYLRLSPENGEYMLKLTKYDFTYHTDKLIGEIDPEALLEQQVRSIRFLARKFIGDLENPGKIFVFRQNEPLSAVDLVDLRLALAAYGPCTLLWVAPACAMHPPGSVDVVDERFMVGYVRRLAPRSQVPELDYGSWMTVLRRSHGLWRRGLGNVLAGGGGRAAPPCTELTFGLEGNAAPALGHGWSGPEPGYAWSVGERSLVTLPLPAGAEEYWLEMDVIPFVAPPLLPRQRLDVIVEGVIIASFDPLPRGVVTGVIPGALARGRNAVEIVLNHPDAASPMLVAGGADDRRLAVSFRRISLFASG